MYHRSVDRSISRRELLQLGLLPALPSPAEAPQTSTPLTYVIDYAMDHLDRLDAYVREVAAAAPQLLHLGHDTPFKGGSGPRRAPEPLGGAQAARYPLLSPAATGEYIQALKQLIDRLHRAGVEMVIPYVCNQTIGGDDRQRRGLWEFYDHWDEYREFGLPAKPQADPVEWLQRDPEGNIHFNYPKTHPGFAPGYRWAPCPNNEHWDLYLRFVVQQIAGCGYDGVFVDNNILHCYCHYCQAAFKRYLASRYSSRELKRCFGAADPGRLRMNWDADKTWWAKKQPAFREFLLSPANREEFEKRFPGNQLRSLAELNEAGNGYLQGRARAFIGGLKDPPSLGLDKPADRLLWFETQRFWAWSIGECLSRLKQAGEKHKQGFLVLPNWGAMESIRNVDDRRVDAKHVAEWRRGSVYLMFEEDGMPGRRAAGVYHDFLLQYKFGLAHGARPVVLPYGKATPANLELAHAEAAASGGGAFVQSGYQHPEVRRQYRDFFTRRPELFRGLESFAHIGVAFLFNQLLLENVDHLKHQYHLKKALASGHFFFDYLTETGLTRQRLERYTLIILPQVRYIADATVAVLKSWVARGGSLVITGDLGSHDETARARAMPAFTGGKERVTWVRQVDSLAPLSQDEEKLLYLGGQQFARALEQMSPANVRTEAPLVSLVSKLTGKNLRFADREDIPGLRANAYWSRQKRQARLVVHFVNYEPSPVRDLPVSILAPHGAWRLLRLRAHSPARETIPELAGRIDGGYLKFVAPEIRIHEIVEAELRD